MKGAFSFDTLTENSILVFYYNEGRSVVYCYQHSGEMEQCLRSCDSCPLTRATIPFFHVRVGNIADENLKTLILANTDANDDAVKSRIATLGYNQNNLATKKTPIAFSRGEYNRGARFNYVNADVDARNLIITLNSIQRDLDNQSYTFRTRRQTRQHSNAWSAFHGTAFFLGAGAFLISLAFPGTYQIMPFLLHANTSLILSLGVCFGSLSWGLSYIAKGVINFCKPSRNINQEDIPPPTFNVSTRVPPTGELNDIPLDNLDELNAEIFDRFLFAPTPLYTGNQGIHFSHSPRRIV